MWFLNDILVFNPRITTVVLWMLAVLTIAAAVFSFKHLLRGILDDEDKPASKLTILSFFAFPFFFFTAVIVIVFSNNLDSYKDLEGYTYSETSNVVESTSIVSLDHGFDMSGTVRGRYYVRSIELEQEKYFMYITKRGSETEHGQEYQENKIGADSVRIFEKTGVESPSLNTIEDCTTVTRESDGATRQECSSYQAFIIPEGSIEHKTSIN